MRDAYSDAPSKQLLKKSLLEIELFFHLDGFDDVYFQVNEWCFPTQVIFPTVYIILTFSS